MAGEQAKPTDSPATAAPAVAAAPPAPSSDSPPAAASAAAIPEAAAAPAPEATAPAPEPAKAAEPAPTLLQQFDKDAAANPAESPKSEAEPAKSEAEGSKDAPKTEAKPGEKPAEAAKPAEPAKLEPVAYEYALPETIKMDDGLKTEFHTALDSFRADPAKGAQPLIDLHNKAMENYAAQVDQNQRDVWNDTRNGWQTSAMADEQIGGSGHQTAMGVIARMRDMFVPEKDRAAFEQFLSVTGAGDHPSFLKMLHNVGRAYDEPAMPPPNVKPSPTNGANPNGRRAVMYDHPRSNPNRQQ